MIERLFGRKTVKMPASAVRTCRVVTWMGCAAASVIVGCTEPTGRPPIEPGPPENRVIVLEGTAGAYRV
ncbi:MAG: hypothetical protein ACREKI_03820, partial [Gemmatimonadota bacterium]